LRRSRLRISTDFCARVAVEWPQRRWRERPALCVRFLNSFTLPG
jgi:hypothetical protein